MTREVCIILVISRKSTYVIIWVPSWTSWFLNRTPFLLERMTDRQTMVILTWVLAEIFSKTKAVTVGKTLIVFIGNDKIQALQQKLESGKVCMPPCEHESFPTLNGLSEEISNVIKTYDYFWILQDKMCQHWGDLRTQWTNAFQLTSIRWCNIT